MLLPTQESLYTVVQSLLDKDYVENPNAPIQGRLEYAEEYPQVNFESTQTHNVLDHNYTELNKSLQCAYENQFRSFSGTKKKSENDSFDFDSLVRGEY